MEKAIASVLSSEARNCPPMYRSESTPSIVNAYPSNSAIFCQEEPSHELSRAPHGFDTKRVFCATPSPVTPSTYPIPLHLEPFQAARLETVESPAWSK